MSPESLLGFLLQLMAVFLVVFRVRRRRLGYTGILFVGISFIYHGATEVAQLLFPGMNDYRTIVSQGDIDKSIPIVSLAILIFAVAYFLCLRPVSGHKLSIGYSLPLTWVDWRWGIFATLVLQGFLLTPVRLSLGYWSGLITEILPLLTVLSLLEFHRALRGRYLLPVLAYVAGLGMLAGTRSAVLFAALTVLAVLTRYGARIKWKSLLAASLIGLVLILGVSGMRAAVGRLAFATQTNEERIQSLLLGMQYLLSNGLSADVMQDFVYRFDGNAFNGMVALGYDAGVEPAGWTPLLNNFSLAVPTFLNPTKLEAGRLSLNEEDYLVTYFNMPEYQVNGRTGLITRELIDYIPTVWGVLFGAWGTVGLWIVAALLGCFYAMADNWFIRSRSLFAVLCGIGLASATVTIEQGVRVYILTARAAFALFLALMLLRLLLLQSAAIRSRITTGGKSEKWA